MDRTRIQEILASLESRNRIIQNVPYMNRINEREMKDAQPQIPLEIDVRTNVHSDSLNQKWLLEQCEAHIRAEGSVLDAGI